MRRVLLCIVILLTLAVWEGFGQMIKSPKSLILHLSRDSDPGSLWIEYFLTGTFGGYGGFVKTDSKTWDYKVPVSHDGKFAKNLKVIVNGPNYKAALFDVAKKSFDRGIHLKLERRATVRFSGKVLLPPSISGNGLMVSIGYMEKWMCSFFRSSDCFTVAHPIAFVDLDAEGRFKLDLPNFASDPVIAAYADKGEFEFEVRDKKNHKTFYILEPQNVRKSFRGLPVAVVYPFEQNFIAQPWY